MLSTHSLVYAARIAVVLMLVVTIVGFTQAAMTQDTDTAPITGSAERPDDFQAVAPRDHITVIGSDGWGTTGGRSRAELVGYAPNGSVLFYESVWDGYVDVDPVADRGRTVEYVVHKELPNEQCGEADKCTRNAIRRTNLSTGTSEIVFSRVTPGVGGTRWHDADRINETHIAVADIYLDRVFIIDLRTDTIVWQWSFQQQYNISTSGGKWPSDWTHLNDVEVLPDGRLMLSPRNHDQVVFVRPGAGLQPAWTLGADDRHQTLFEQHNPDYIPASRGGPAVLVADSENNRVVEYQRINNSWEQSWAWTDEKLQWPRDADRLSNGHTLITDSNGNRVLEVGLNGSVVWQTTIGLPYESERFPGDESTGPSARQIGLTSRATAVDQGQETGNQDSVPIHTRIVSTVGELLPGTLSNAILFVLPAWIGAFQIVLMLGCLGAVTIWIAVEVRYGAIQLRSPIYLSR